MEMPADDFERLLFLEQNLTKWGGVLLELSQFQTLAESKTMILAAISKLEEALLINPLKHDAIWCLGNAHMVHGLMTPDYNVARNYFDKAAEFYQQAVEEVLFILSYFFVRFVDTLICGCALLSCPVLSCRIQTIKCISSLCNQLLWLRNSIRRSINKV